MKTITNNKILNNHQSKNIILREAVSLDAPPLDFSYKNIKELSDLKAIDSRSGKRKPIIIEAEESKNDKKKKKEVIEGKAEANEKEKEEKNQAQQPGNEGGSGVTGGDVHENSASIDPNNQKQEEKNEDEEKEKDKEKEKEKEKEKKEENQNQQPAQQQNVKKGPEIIRVIPQNNITNTIALHNIPLNNTNNTKNMVGKNFEETNIYSQKKVISVKLVCTALILSYNEIRTLDGFFSIIDLVMYDCRNLGWIDLSHNYLVDLSYNFKEFPLLRTLYLHCNYIKDLKELLNLRNCQNLKAVTIHGNPVETIPNFRILIIGILPQVKKIDTVLVSKKEKDNAFVWINGFKNVVIPEVKNAIQPPEIIQLQPDQK